MRVTNGMMFSSLLTNLRSGMLTMGNLQEQMVTMRRINRPSDDPMGAANAQLLRNGERNYSQYIENIESARGMLDYSAATLELISSQVVSIRSKVLSATSAGSDQVSRDVLAIEIDDMLKSMVAQANSTFNGIYIFGGTSTAQQPFEVASQSGKGVEAVGFNGNSSRINYLVGPNNLVEINENPLDVFMPRGEEQGVFQTLIRMRKLLQNEDKLPESEQIRQLSAGVEELDVIHRDVVRSIGRLGARSSALEMRRDLYSKSHIDSVIRRSNIEDADIVDVTLRLQNQQTIFQVIVASSSSVYSSNLLEFLR